MRRSHRSAPRSSIATKFGFELDPRRRAGSTAGPSTSRASRGVAEAAADRHIDLLYQHRVDPDVPIEDVAGAVAD